MPSPTSPGDMMISTSSGRMLKNAWATNQLHAIERRIAVRFRLQQLRQTGDKADGNDTHAMIWLGGQQLAVLT